MISTDTLKTLLPLALTETNLPLAEKFSGKVRDSYPLDLGRRLLVTTDRLSSFDRVLGAVPFKGQVLNQLAAWWFDQTADIIPNHKLSIPDPNALIAVQAEPFPIEVIVRGYLTGITQTALWHRYSLGERNIYGYELPEGLRKNQLLPSPLITPTTKGDAATGGHDERLTCAEVVEQKWLDANTWDYVQAAALALFERGQELAQRAGLILVDTKYEFGRTPDGKIRLIDEVHTPDSSRFWKENSYQTRFENGEEPENFDKEWIRLAYTARGYRGDGEPPVLDDALWAELGQRYIQTYEMLTGEIFEPGKYPIQERLAKNLEHIL